MKRLAYDRIQLLLQQQRYEMAQQELGQALLKAPEDPLLHALLAHTLLELKQLQTARHHAQQAIVLAPDSGFSYYTLALVQQELNQTKEAQQSLLQALELDPLEPDYYTRLGLLHLLRSRWSEAQQCAEQALALDPEHVDASNLRSMALIRLGQTQAAADSLDQVLLREPENARVHANRGWTLLHQHAPQQAMEAFREALRLEPNLDWAREGMLEAMKAHYWPYRIFQRYVFWMSKHSGLQQFLIMLGMIALIRILSKVAGQYSQVLSLGVLLFYLGFVMLTWLVDPLFNLMLRFHPFGRLVLSADEKQATHWTGTLLLLAGSSAMVGLIGAAEPLLVAAGALVALLVPVSVTFAAPPERRRLLGAYTCCLASLAALGLLSWSLQASGLALLLGLLFLLGWLAFSWFANFLLLRSA